MKAFRNFLFWGLSGLMLCVGPMALADSSTTQDPKQQQFHQAFDTAIKASIKGPAPIKLVDQAVLDLPAGYRFIPAEAASALMSALGSNNADIKGVVIADTNDSDWILNINYIDSGYVEDSEAKKWDADQLLQSIKEGTEEANRERKARGFPIVTVGDWVEKPTYNSAKHLLTWGLFAGDEDGKMDTINYVATALGRDGYMDLKLITGKEDFNANKLHVNKILNAIHYNPGKEYKDYVAGKDHLAAYGIAALVTGVIAKKLGLFALAGVFLLKIWKLLIVLPILLWKKIKKLFQSSRDRNVP